ncbi:uncharacterized [Tachysurus ichikawai]
MRQSDTSDLRVHVHEEVLMWEPAWLERPVSHLTPRQIHILPGSATLSEPGICLASTHTRGNIMREPSETT